MTSNNGFNFGMDDVWTDETSSRPLARGVAVGLGVVFLVLSGLTTFLFFEQYATAVGSWAGPAAAGLVAGVIGVLCLDLGSIAWSFVRSRAATSGGQMTVALVASALDLVMSLLTSALFIALSTTLETGLYRSDGSLTELGLWTNYLGVAVITLSLLVNFSAVYLWMHLGADTRAAEQSTSLRAVVMAGRHRVDAARTRMVVDRTMEEIARQLPELSDELARGQGRVYLDTTMRRPEPRPAPPPYSTMSSQNGTADSRPTRGR